jgi:hypothetical protein
MRPEEAEMGLRKASVGLGGLSESEFWTSDDGKSKMRVDRNGRPPIQCEIPAVSVVS